MIVNLDNHGDDTQCSLSPGRKIDILLSVQQSLRNDARFILLIEKIHLHHIFFQTKEIFFPEAVLSLTSQLIILAEEGQLTYLDVIAFITHSNIGLCSIILIIHFLSAICIIIQKQRDGATKLLSSGLFDLICAFDCFENLFDFILTMFHELIKLGITFSSVSDFIFIFDYPL